MGDQEDFFGFLQLIHDEMPGIFAVIQQPGILQVALNIINARKAGAPLTQQQIQDQYQNTDFYKNTPEQGRQWYIALATDPASANQLKEQRAQQITNWLSQQGLPVSQDEANTIAGISLARGYDTSGWQHDILNSPFYTSLLERSTHGASPIGDDLDKAARDMGIPISPLTRLDWQRKIALGEVDMNTFQSYLTEQAKSLYPGLADAIDAGVTVRQYADPYAQIASKELGINPADFDLTDPKWSTALQQKDPKTGANTAMTLQSWQSHIRSDPTYGFDQTTGARDQAAQFATRLAQQFGAMGS